MKHTDFLKYMEKNTPLIKRENRLFFNLWCVSFTFDHINDRNYSRYRDFEILIDWFWKMNDSSHLDFSILESEVTESVMSITEEEWEDLDDFEVSQKAIKETLYILQTLIINLRDFKEIRLSCFENPFNLLDTIVDVIKIRSDNTHQAYLKEVKAHYAIMEVITQKAVSYTRKDRNIFRI